MLSYREYSSDEVSLAHRRYREVTGFGRDPNDFSIWLRGNPYWEGLPLRVAAGEWHKIEILLSPHYKTLFRAHLLRNASRFEEN